ncbi:MAG: DUF1987 domain-containing protein [Salinivirgaceae bacterium]|jgi:hypothetical protein|nr:DUF1987 domain-containing protein [Salinivirgaceae bacterium]
MKDLIITGNKQKPDLMFSATTGLLNVSGQSLPENATLLYGPVLEWIKEYAKSPAPKTVFSLKMKYYNTASSKMFFSIIKSLNVLYKAGSDIEIEWHYQDDDEDMLDAGEYFRDLVDIPFHFMPY